MPQNEVSETLVPSDDVNGRIARAIHFLAENSERQPSLDDAAKIADLSPSHFQREFVKLAGVSPKNFVAHLTLARAKEELRNGQSVLDAALEAGLSAPSRLHDLCLKIEAMTPGEYAKGGAGLSVYYDFAQSLFGNAILTATDKGLCGLGFGDDESEMLDDMTRRWPRAEFMRDAGRLKPYATKIFSQGGDINLHLLGTKWQIKVWQALIEIPEGTVTSYAALAAKVGAKSAARATGTAVGRNPVSLLIPCHRVLGASGAITGYHWGITRKRAMLAWEAARQDAKTHGAEN